MSIHIEIPTLGFTPALSPFIESKGGACSSRTIFEQEWWLRAASCGSIEQVEVEWDGVTVGSLYFYAVRRPMIRKGMMPPYTRILSPNLNGPAGKSAAVMANNIKIIAELDSKLRGLDVYATTVRADDVSLVPFQLNSFHVGAKITFVSPAAVSMSTVRSNMHQKVRNLVKTGAEQLQLVSDYDLDSFRSTVARRDEADRNDYRALGNIVEELRSRSAGTILSAVDNHGKKLASAIVVWDDQRLYYLACARKIGEVANKASALLFYESIALAKSKGLDFDADGYATVASAKSLLRWGMPISVNFNVMRGNTFYQAMKPIKERFGRSAF